MTRPTASLPNDDLERKAVTGDVTAAFEDFNTAFSAFKETNDQRLSQIEGRLSADALTEEKLARIDGALQAAQRRLDDLLLKQARPALGGEAVPRPGEEREYKAAFAHYVRSGEASGLKRLEAKALSAGSGPDGGYVVPPQVEGDILRRLAQISPIRAISSVRLVSGGQYRRAFSTSGFATGWVGETAARDETEAGTLAELSFPAAELYAMPAATQTLLDDAIVDIDAWIAEEVEQAFAEQEGQAFVKGDGVNKPKGFLDYPKAANADWAWGKTGFVATGAAGAFPAANPSDVLVDLTYALKAGYRQNGSFVMSRKTLSAIRKFKDGQGHYLWQPPASPGAVSTLMNFPVVEAEDMPDIAADAFAVAFGDFRRGYLVVDRQGIRILRDPYSAKPYVLFYTTKRVGGGIQDFDAIKLLKFAAN